MATVKVKYKGLSEIRSMSVQELAEHNVHVSEDLVWVRRSVLDPSIYMDSPSDELLAIFAAEGTFEVEEIKDSLQGDVGVIVMADPAKADDTGATVVDGNTGEKSTKPSGR